MTNNWQEEFFERFGANKIWVTPSRDNVEIILEIHAFITSLLQKQRHSTLEDVERAILDGIPKKDKYIFTSTSIKDETHKREDNEPFTAEGWNSCRHTLLKLIKKLMEK